MGNSGGMVEGKRDRGRPRVTWTDIKVLMGNSGGMVEGKRDNEI